MNLTIRKEELEALREKYPLGCRVELVKMDDPYREMPSGLQGMVTGVDDSGSIHVNWQNGSSLAVIFGEDECRKVEDGEVTVGELLRRYVSRRKEFHFMTPSGYVDLTARDAASRPKIEGKTNEESREVQTETLTIKARPLASGYVKAKTGNKTSAETYANWYKSVYLPEPKAVDAETEGQG